MLLHQEPLPTSTKMRRWKTRLPPTQVKTLMILFLITWSIEFEWFIWGRLIFPAAPPNVIDLPYDGEDVAPKPRKSKKVAAGRMSQQGPTTTPPIRQSEDAGGASVTFAAPLSSEHSTLPTAPVIPSVVQLHATELQATAPGSSAHFFTSYPIPDNQSKAAAEAI